MPARLWPAVGSILFLVIAPGTVAGLIPYQISRWRLREPYLGFAGFRVLGVLLVLVGISILLDSFGRFAVQGLGTPAPVYPTKSLVVSGWYRYVRNPMYVAVLWTVLGQALLFGSQSLLWYFAALAVGFHVFVMAYEEPTLRARYPAEYATYCAHVRRWWPRFTPWHGNDPPQRAEAHSPPCCG